MRRAAGPSACTCMSMHPCEHTDYGGTMKALGSFLLFCFELTAGGAERAASERFLREIFRKDKSSIGTEAAGEEKGLRLN